MIDIEDITRQLFEIRQAEAEITARRIALENEFTRAAKMPDDFTGSKTFNQIQGFKVKVTRQLRTTVDGEQLQALADKYKIGEEIHTLFRWNPELVKKAWDTASENLKSMLAPAITTKMGKASVSVELQEEV